jgi:hypothetical protein
MFIKEKSFYILSNFIDYETLKDYNIIDVDVFLDNQAQMIVDTYNNLLNIKNLLQNNNISSSDTIILFEYAGFGDTIHTRYLIQHIQEKYKNIVWITLGLIQDLYREHEELIIFSNTINNRLRNPSSPIVQAFSELMLETFNYIFNDISLIFL